MITSRSEGQMKGHGLLRHYLVHYSASTPYTCSLPREDIATIRLRYSAALATDRSLLSVLAVWYSIVLGGTLPRRWTVPFEYVSNKDLYGSSSTDVYYPSSDASGGGQMV